MRHNSKRLRSALKALRSLAITQLFALVLTLATTAAAQTEVPLAPFRSIELRGGGFRAILRHGPTQRVTLLKGGMDYSRFTLTDGGRLVIDRCRAECPSGYRLEIEIVTPEISGILLEDGGSIQSRGSFPQQATLTAAVRSGGTIDIRSMLPDRLIASVEEGGRIFAMPQIALSARVVNGGNVTYWGDPRVEQSIRNGGVIVKGAASEADKPLSELTDSHQYVPPVPPFPQSRRCARFNPFGILSLLNGSPMGLNIGFIEPSTSSYR